MIFFATCPKGLESLLAEELTTLGAISTKETRAGVNFEATLATVYEMCLWSRLANHIFLELGNFPVTSTEDVYQIALNFPWNEHMTEEQTFAIDTDLINSTFTNSLFITQKFKDGLVDYWRQEKGTRPNVEITQPDIRFHVLIKKDQLILSFNLSGDSLHRRGYRPGGGSAPLKENLAAALLMRAGWPEIAKQGGSLLDPLCGSGTLLIEAALMAGDIAPGLHRSYFGFLKWLKFQPKTWETILQAALARKEAGLKSIPRIVGYDGDLTALHLAQENITRVGLDKYIHTERRELAQIQPLSITPGLVITNPPYGERLGEIESLMFMYQHLGEIFKAHFQAWRCSVFTGNPDLAKALRLGPEKIYRLFNGAIPCQLLNFIVRPKNPETTVPFIPKLALTEGQDFANRLKKNIQKLEPTAKRENITCYRLYDADLPDYAIVIDRYENQIHVQEYAPPKSIDPEKAARRLEVALHHISQILEIPENQCFLKTRIKQKGANQYHKQANLGKFYTVQEGPAKLLVNFIDYLDTGLFLDSRPIRQWIFERVSGKQFLNLFCYTGSATVLAALGKAARTVSVDMSATYLEWAKKNLALNGIAPTKHQFVQADCIQWLQTNTEKFELILLDPPTFSNSKRMEETLDIERDQLELIRFTMRHLTKDGTLIFVTNKKNFKLNPELIAEFSIEDVTDASLPFDFKRSISHQAYLIRHT